MTGDDVHVIGERLAAVGLAAVEVIAKPFEPHELIESLDRAR
jgi:hypothetical protein